jgi:hypothetical protein
MCCHNRYHGHAVKCVFSTLDSSVILGGRFTNDYIKKDVKGGTCSMHGGDEKYIQSFSRKSQGKIRL